MWNWAASLRTKDFRLLWASTAFYSLATGMEQVSVGWLIYDAHGSEFMVGVAAAARMLPFFVLRHVVGSHRRPVVATDPAARRYSGGFGVALLMGLMLLQGFVNVLGIDRPGDRPGQHAGAFTITIRQAFTYDIVGSGWRSTGWPWPPWQCRAAGIIGSLVSGAMIDLVGPGWQFIASAAFYAVSAGATLLIDNEGRSLRASSDLSWPT